MSFERMPELPADLESLAADLASLTPAGCTFPRDALMYRAGWEACAAWSESTVSPTAKGSGHFSLQQATIGSVRRMAWLWPLSVAGLLLVSVSLGIALVMRTPEISVVYIEQQTTGSPRGKPSPDSPPTVDSRISKNENVATAPTEPMATISRHSFLRAGADYLSLRERVLAFGVDVLRPDNTATSPEADGAETDSRYGTLIGQLRGG
jgi:hypothetical protein